MGDRIHVPIPPAMFWSQAALLQVDLPADPQLVVLQNSYPLLLCSQHQCIPPAQCAVWTCTTDRITGVAGCQLCSVDML